MSAAYICGRLPREPDVIQFIRLRHSGGVLPVCVRRLVRPDHTQPMAVACLPRREDLRSRATFRRDLRTHTIARSVVRGLERELRDTFGSAADLAAKPLLTRYHHSNRISAHHASPCLTVLHSLRPRGVKHSCYQGSHMVVREASICINSETLMLLVYVAGLCEENHAF